MAKNFRKKYLQNTYKKYPSFLRIFFLRESVRNSGGKKVILRAKKKILTKYLQKVPVA